MLSCVMRTEDGLAVTAIAPVSVETEVNGKRAALEVETDYPFRDSIPGFCRRKRRSLQYPSGFPALRRRL